MAQLIDGKAIAALIRAEQATRAAYLKENGIEPALAVILVGEDPASKVYVRNKARACKECGIRSEVIRMSAETTQAELMAEIERVNSDPALHGLLIQLPLPAHLDEAAALAAVDWRKDVDGFHKMNAGALLEGEEGVRPCTPAGCMELLRRSHVPLTGAKAVVVGRSNIVGKPMALMLLEANCTVTICHSRRDCQRRRHRGRRGWQGKFHHRRYDQAGRGCDRRGHQPARGRHAVRRRGFRRGAGKGRLDHTRARRRRPDDHRHADEKHAGRGRKAWTLTGR